MPTVSNNSNVNFVLYTKDNFDTNSDGAKTYESTGDIVFVEKCSAIYLNGTYYGISEDQKKAILDIATKVGNIELKMGNYTAITTTLIGIIESLRKSVDGMTIEDGEPPGTPKLWNKTGVLSSSTNIVEAIEALAQRINMMPTEFEAMARQMIDDELYTKYINGYEFVDMGLSVLWATCNIGATKPEDDGWYFRWGDTKAYNSDRTPVGGGPAEEFICNSNVPYWVSGQYELGDENHVNTTFENDTKWSKYTNEDKHSSTGVADNKTVLEPMDDAACYHISEDCRLPTKEEWEELIKACNIVSKYDYNGTGINVQLFTLKTDISKTLVFPKAGLLKAVKTASGTTKSDHYFKGTQGCYLSSSLHSEYAYFSGPKIEASDAYFGKTGVTMSMGTRECAISIRAVTPMKTTYLPSTRIKYYATNEDLENYATKEELSGYEKKGDYVTKKEIYEDVKNDVVIDDWEFVDMGLSVLWATRNVGAKNIFDNGWYFSWGDTTPYNYDRTPVEGGEAIKFAWTTYPHCNGTNKTLTKYCTDASYGDVDNRTILEPEDDAANAYAFSDCRMPTTEEFQELIDACDSWWFKQDEGCGWAFRLKTDPSKIIIFPAAGNLSSNSNNINTAGCYWASNINPSSPDKAGYLYFYYDGVNSSKKINYDSRYFGTTIRPVMPNKTIKYLSKSDAKKLYVESNKIDDMISNATVAVSKRVICESVKINELDKVPANCQMCTINTSTGGTFDIDGTLESGAEIQVFINNNGSKDIEVDIPSKFKSNGTHKIVILAGNYGEINVISDGFRTYLRAIDGCV